MDLNELQTDNINCVLMVLQLFSFRKITNMEFYKEILMFMTKISDLFQVKVFFKFFL